MIGTAINAAGPSLRPLSRAGRPVRITSANAAVT